ncbi:MAG: YkgJ family cysteine cluster protein [Kiritimatiellae bacterium]|nr:YkgJ family cysteine cluster protein [Kiritimatiellia bacterium]
MTIIDKAAKALKAAGDDCGRSGYRLKIHDEFRCRRCGACCRIKDGIVRVSDAEIARIADFLGMTEAEFIDRETEVAPDRRGLILKSRPDGACAWLSDDNLCRINPVKPDKCRTFPLEWVNSDSFKVCPELGQSTDSR